MWLTEMRNKTDPPIMVKEVVPVIQKRFPSYDAQLHSKVERPEKYGIELCKEAERDICLHFGFERKTASKGRKPEKRTLPYRSCRLGKDEYTRLQTLLGAFGGITVQDWLRPIVIRCINEQEGTAYQTKGVTMQEKTIVSVQYRNRYNKKTEEYSGRQYSYYCTIPVTVGDKVIAPTAKGASEAKVCAVGISPAALDKSVLAVLKTITERVEEGAASNAE